MEPDRRRRDLLGDLTGSGSWSLHSSSHSLSMRQLHSFTRRGLMQETLIFVIIVSVGAVALSCVVGWVYYKRRQQRKQDAKYQQALGGDNLEAQPTPQQAGSGSARSRTQMAAAASRSRNNASSSRTNGNNTNATTAAATVDRNTSVRSVMTLPAYRLNASNNEQVLGREGERDGIDTVVDLPTEEDMEALRDEEMEAMYQIRVARRNQIEEQQQRRVQRQEAQQRGDSAALASIRAQVRASRSSNPLDSLRREMERAKELRHKSVSSVSYAELGVARHDGTRIRASSNDSERMALLDEAAAAAGTTSRAARLSEVSTLSASVHQRAGSVSSMFSADSDSVSGGPSLSLSRSQGPLLPADSHPEPEAVDVGDEHIPPPEYENISLADEGDSLQSIASFNEPPPDYPGPRRSASQATQREQGTTEASTTEDGAGTSNRLSGGPNDVPRLPSLRLTQLPEIVIGP